MKSRKAEGRESIESVGAEVQLQQRQGRSRETRQINKARRIGEKMGRRAAIWRIKRRWCQAESRIPGCK